MAEFDNIRAVGGLTKLYVAIQGVSNDPETSTLLPLGAVSTITFSIDGNVLEANDSLTSSGFTENQMGKSQVSISCSGNYVRDPSAYPNFQFINALQQHRIATVKQDISQDPVILVRVDAPDYTFTAYMLINSISIENPNSELSTFSMELSNATSPIYPPIYELK